MVEDTGGRANQIGAIVSPGETGHRLVGRALRGVQRGCATLTIDVAEGGVVLICVVDAEAHGGVSDQMLSWVIVDFSLDCHTLGGHAVKGGLVEADCSSRSVGVIWVDRNYSHGVGGVIIEPVQPGSGSV